MFLDNRFSRRAWISFATLIGALLTAAEPVKPVNTGRGNLAIHGYDPVAYFDEGRPIKGSAEFSHSWMGATWRFASAAHRDKFAARPDAFAPRYGGYCAWAVSKGYTANGDPEAWKIVDGKLYLNYNLKVQKDWEHDVAKRIESANANWPRLHRAAPGQ